MILFLKAVDRHDTQTLALFVTPTIIDGYTRKDGTLVRPHVARRPHAPAKHPATVAAKQHELLNFEHNAPVNSTGAEMDAELKGIPAAVASLAPGVPMDEQEPQRWGPPNKRDVPEYLMSLVEAIIEKANRRAKKLGVDGFSLVKGEPFDRDVSKDKSGLGIHEPRWVRFIPCTIEGPAIKAPGGWKLQGRVDFEDGSVIVNSRPGHELPKRFRSITPMCDHCKSDRQRNAVFVFGREGDDYMQVGRSCLKDYLGHSPEAALWAASEFSIFDDIDRELDEDRASGGSRSQLVGLDDVMTAAAYAVRRHGFVSRKAADERGGSPTSVDVSNYLFDKREVRAEYLKNVTQADKDKAAAVIAWVQAEWASKDETSDYEYNAVELTGRRAVHVRRIGLLTSLVAAYDRAHEEKVARAKRVDAWVGKVGERREFEATFAGLNQFDTAFGVMFVARFDTPEGLLVYKGGTIWWPVPIEAGTPVRFKGTIKEHADYKGTKQTLVSRCQIVEAKPEKPAKAKKTAAVAA